MPLLFRSKKPDPKDRLLTYIVSCEACPWHVAISVWPSQKMTKRDILSHVLENAPSPAECQHFTSEAVNALENVEIGVVVV